jgi:DNA-binding MarR family transcriptional regulator
MVENDLSNYNDSELSVLRTIRESESSAERLTQRELARATGISLGMINMLLRRLAERGWVKLTRLSPKTMRYALTSAGLSELARRTAGYFSRASRSAELYRDRLEAYAVKAKRDGARTIVLYGSSEVEFLIAYVCERHGLVFVKSSDKEKARQLARKSGGILLLAEGEAIGPEDALGPQDGSLALVLSGAEYAPTGNR